ncbi:MAG: AsmA family protein [Acidobacteria bacterium]|nr:AsmA family protein [Acidobacteriota bacterium]
MKRKGVVIAAILGGILLLLLAIPLFVNVDSFRPRVESELSAALGREVKIGKLSFSLLAGGVSASDITIADDPAFQKGPFLTVKSVDIGVDLLPLIFSRSLRVRSLTLEEPQVTLLSAPGGKWNFSSIGATDGKKKAPAGAVPDVSVGTLKVVDGKLIVGSVSGRTRNPRTQTYEEVNLVASNVSFTSPISFTFEAKTPGGGAVNLDGKAGPIERSDAAHTPLNADVKLERFNLGTSGFLDPSSGMAGLMDFTGKVKSDGKTARAEGKATATQLRMVRGGQPAKSPVGFDFATDYDATRQAGTLVRGDIRTGSSTARLTGSYDTRGASPVVHLKLKGEQLPVNDVQGLLPAFGVVLPPGSSLQGGVASANLSIDGPLDRLIITGPVNVSNTKLAGFNLGSKMAALAAFSGVRTGSDTVIETMSSQLRVAPEGINASNLNIVVPSIGTVTGAGAIGSNSSLNFKMLARLSGGGGALGGLSTLSSLGQSKGALPFLIQGTTSNPIFVPDVAGAMTQTVAAPAEGVGGILGGLFGKKKKTE